MKFTLSWLKEHLETTATLDEITEALTDLGLEVEGVTDPAAKLAPFTIARVTEAVQCLKWRAEDATLFAAAPDTGSILMLKPGTPGVRRLATVPKGSGAVSGLAFDREGGIWTCLRGGWGVVRFAPDGGLDRVVGLPVPCPTDLAFDGQFSSLYVATARQPVSLEVLNDAPLSGRLFKVVSAEPT